MNPKLTNYLNGVFTPYDGVKSVTELKADLLSDLQERYRELKAEGKDDETAFATTIASIGDIEQTILEVANLSRSLERQVLTNFSASNLTQSDFAGVTAHKGQFNASALHGSNFSGADIDRQLVQEQRHARSELRRRQPDRLQHLGRGSRQCELQSIAACPHELRHYGTGRHDVQRMSN